MNLILQILINHASLNPVKHEIYKTCCKTVKRYASNIGCDYSMETSQFFKQYPPHFEIFRVVIEPRFETYDKIFVIDADVFSRNTSDNIFDYYDTFAAQRAAVATNKHRPEFAISKDFLNSGIVMFDKTTRNKLKPHVAQEMEACRRVVPGRDQLALNKLAFAHLGGYTRIDPKHACYLRDNTAKQSILVHMAGRCRQLYLNDAKTWDIHFEVADLD